MSEVVPNLYPRSSSSSLYLKVIIDLSVINDDQPVIDHGLVSPVAQVDDAQPVVTQQHRHLHPGRGIVGPPMANRAEHLFEEGLSLLASQPRVNHACNATHENLGVSKLYVSVGSHIQVLMRAIFVAGGHYSNSATRAYMHTAVDQSRDHEKR